MFFFFTSRLLSVVYLNYNKLETFGNHSFNKKKEAVNILVNELDFSKNDILTKAAYSENKKSELELCLLHLDFSLKIMTLKIRVMILMIKVVPFSLSIFKK